MKSTPTRGVKENLKPDAYKQSEVWTTVDRGWRTEERSSGICRLLSVV